METFLVAYEPRLRLAFFLGILVVMASWEALRPFRVPTQSRLRRWAHNLGLVGVGSVAVRLVFPFAAVGLATRASEHGWGLLNLWDGPAWLELVLAVVALDFVIWAQHVMFHFVPALWRLHRVHHADPDYDFTTGVRFHPVEILLSMGLKFAAVLVLGPSPSAIIVFEVVLNGMAMFNHGNVALPAGLDRVLRRFVVTPAMHRVHHSVELDETNSNFGFNLAWWDLWLGTAKQAPRAGQREMVIGVEGLRVEPSFAALLLLPFRRPSTPR